MSFDYQLLGKKLTEARKNQQYQVSEVASFINKSNDDYLKIEQGDYITLDGNTIVLLAKLLKIDFRYLVTGNYPSAESQIKELFRQNSALSNNDRRAIQTFIRLCETKNDIEDLLKLPKQVPIQYSIRDFNTPIHKNQGIIAANKERKRLRISDSIPNIYSLLRQQKVHIFRRTLEDRNISGVYIRHPNAGHCILINYVDDIYRQNFSAAHEYCHVLFDSESEQRVSYEKSKDYIEIRANNFAGNFLVPASVFTQLNNPSYEFLLSWVLNVCKKYKVNKYIIIYRLSDLGIITKDVKEILLKDRKLNFLNSYKEDPELSDVSPNLITPIEELIRSGISLEYINLCRNAYQQGLITYSKLVSSFLLDFVEGTQIAAMMNVLMEV